MTIRNVNILRAAGMGVALLFWLGVSACGSGDDSSNSVANPPGGGLPTLSVVSPSPGATFPPGPVPVSLATENFSIGLQGESHIHFFLDNDLTPYEFFSGPDEDTGILYQGGHTHIAHWKTSTSFTIFEQPSGSHQVRLELVDSAHNPLGNPGSVQTFAFTITNPGGGSGELRIEPVLDGLNFPVSMALAPDGRIFFNELRTGNVRIVDIVGGVWTLRPTPFYHVDAGQGVDQGLLGIVLDQNFSANRFVYIYYVTGNGTQNRLIRLKEVNGQGTDETPILEGVSAGQIHNGGILRFGPDGKLYVTIGEWNRPNLAQDLNSLGGKILRLNADGSPASNPFPSGNPSIYAMGLRSTFGMVFHPQTGHLWVTENGPNTNDEINRIVAGGNYGWPIVRGIANDQRFLDPILAITPTVGPTGLAVIPPNSLYPASFHNNLLFAEVNGGKLHRIVLAGAQLDQLGSVSVAFNGGLGGLLDIIQGPGGYLYVSGFSAIYRIVPNP